MFCFDSYHPAIHISHVFCLFDLTKRVRQHYVRTDQPITGSAIANNMKKIATFSKY